MADEFGLVERSPDAIPGGVETTPWVDLFQSLWSANTPAWVCTLRTWAHLFHAEGRSNIELVHAIFAVSKRTKLPQFPVDHLQALREEIRTQDEQISRERESVRVAREVIRCTLCGDCGMVCGLPHLACVDGPQWLPPRNTVAVTCTCQAGSQSAARWRERGKPSLSYHDYQCQNPNYEAQLTTRAAEVAAEMATFRQQHGDGSWDRSIAAILARADGGRHSPGLQKNT